MCSLGEGLRQRAARSWAAATGRASRAARRVRHPTLERLEPRQLLAVSVSISNSVAVPTSARSAFIGPLSPVPPPMLASFTTVPDSGAAGSGPWSSPGPGGPPVFQGTAKIVEDTILGGPPPWPATPPVTPPDQLRNAKPLPDSDLVQATGTVAASQGPMYFRITLNEGTASLDIQLQSSDRTRPVMELVMLLDESGHDLFSMRGDVGTSRLSLHVYLPPGYEHRSIYLSIAMPSPSAGLDSASGPSSPVGANPVVPPAVSQVTPVDPTTSGFVLQVTRESISVTSPASSDPTVLGPSQSTTSQAGARVGSPASLSPDETIQPVGTAPAGVRTSPPVALPIATGPLPSLSAAPLGGILAIEGDPTPRVAIRDTTAIDLALSDLAQVHEENDDNVALAAAEGTPVEFGPHDDGTVVTLRGPGGFPLLGSLLMAENRGVRPSAWGELPAISFARPPRLSPTTTNPDSGPSEEPASTLPRPPAAGAIRRVSIVAGVSIAFAFVSGLIFPALIDPFRPEASLRSTLRNLLPKRNRQDDV